MSSLVFSSEFIQSLENKYIEHKRYMKPAIYFYATLEHYVDLRNEVEELYLAVPDELKPQILSRLHSSDQFVEIYNELITRNFLQIYATNLYQTEMKK